MNRDRILLVIPNNLDIGGIQNVIMNIVRNLSDEFVFDIICLDYKESYYDHEFLSYGGKIFRFLKADIKCSFRRKLDFYIRGKRILSFVKSTILYNGPYIAVHSNIGIEDCLVLKAAKDCNVPVRISHAHTSFKRQYNFVAKLYSIYLIKLLDKYTTNKIACSNEAGKISFRNTDYKIVYNTIDKRFFEPVSYFVNHSAPVLIQIGLICDNKNQIFSVEILKALKDIFPQACLVLIGSAKNSEMESYKNRLLEKIKKEDLYNSVTLLQADSDIKAELLKADYLLLPSKVEGLGIVLIEAQSLGMKCFISNSVPTEANCGGGIFLNLSDGATEWAKRISVEFESDHGNRNSYDMSRFSIDIIMNQYKNLYRGINIHA